MVCAFYFYNARESGTPTWLALALALLLGAAIGVAIHLVIMRPLRQRARALAADRDARPLHRVLRVRAEPLRHQHPHHHEADRADRASRCLPDISIGRDRVVLLAIGVRAHRSSSPSCTATPGSATRPRRWPRAGGPPPRRASRPTGSPRSTGRSARCSARSRPILIVNLSGLQVITLTLLIVPALAAALVGQLQVVLAHPASVAC